MNVLRSSIAAAVVAAMLLSSVNALAAAISFPEPTGWSAGDPGSTFQEWSAGVASASASILDPAGLSVLTNPVLGDAPVLGQTGAFVASSGGFYSFSDIYSIKASIPNHGSAGVGTGVLVQTAGTLNPDYDPEGDATGGSVIQDTIKILDKDGNVLATSDPGNVVRTFYGADYPLFGGVQFEKLAWEVFLPGYTDDFSVAANVMIHSSFQALRVDSVITAVPEPGSLALAALGSFVLVVGACWKNRRTRVATR